MNSLEKNLKNLALNQTKFNLIKELKIRKARESFWEYRKLINPKLKIGWFQKEIAENLQEFYDEYSNGKAPTLVIEAPPQHGKSVQIVDFISWLSGKNPNLKSIYTSFSDRLGVRANLSLQRIYDSEIYKEIFPDTQISNKDNKTEGKYKKTEQLLEYVGKNGSFRNTTVRGSITGESLDLGIIDDPIKGRQDANSETVREAAWNWFTDDFFTRFSEEAGLICILTRWHVDDPIGRLIKKDSSIKVLKYRAIAIKDEKHRIQGEPLFPEHKSLEFLLKRKKIMSDANWQALYQQNPMIQGGNLFKDKYYQYYKTLPNILYRMIYADTAQKTNEKNDYSVFQCWGFGEDKKIYLLDLIRDKWEAPELLINARSFYNKHKFIENCGILSGMKVEDKSSGTGLIQTLSRENIPILGIPRSKDKVERANGVINFVKTGFVFFPEEAHFLSEFLEELRQFPNGKHDDQVDPFIDAIEDLLGNSIEFFLG